VGSQAATGGLLSMIEPLARQPNVAWFCCVSEPPESEAERDALYVTAKDQTDPELNVVPVPLPADIYRDYYGKISNEILYASESKVNVWCRARFHNGKICIDRALP